MTELRSLIEKLREINFSGKSDYYPDDGSDARLIMEYSPNKLRVRNKSPYYDHEIILDFGFDDNFNIISLKESENGRLIKEYSASDIAKTLEYGILGKYLFNDPRYVFHIGQNTQKIDDLVWLTKVYEEDMFGKTMTIYVLFLVRNDKIRAIQKRQLIGKKELENQRRTVVFTY